MMMLRIPGHASIAGALTAGALTLAAAAVSLWMAIAGPPAPATLADPCNGGVNVSILQEGVPINNCGPEIPAPALTGGAPSQGLLTACSGIPGCLSNALYGPGNVLVPQPNTTVQQSQ